VSSRHVMSGHGSEKEKGLPRRAIIGVVGGNEADISTVRAAERAAMRGALDAAQPATATKFGLDR
jgi:hypothetical protein